MNPIVLVSLFVVAVSAAPADLLVGHHAIPAAQISVGPKSAPYEAPHLAVPNGVVTAHQEPGTTSIHQPPSVHTKKTLYGTSEYISGYSTRILKPAVHHIPAQLPTVILNKAVVNPAQVRVVEPVHEVSKPEYVERRVEVPYEVPVYEHHTQEVEVPHYVKKPYAVPYAVPVQGAPIVNREHTVSYAPAAVHHSVAAPVAVGHAVAAPVAVGHATVGHAVATPVAAVHAA